MKPFRIGAGAGYSGDRIEPAQDLAQRGALNALVFECLAERTIAMAQLRRSQDPAQGYDLLLQDRMRAVLPPCLQNNTTVITNMGAANPLAAGHAVLQVAKELGLKRLKVAVVEGDDVLPWMRSHDVPLQNSHQTSASLARQLISANAYLGADALLPALQTNADVVIAGRVADPALFLAPLMHHFGWAATDWPRLGQGLVVGHLLECAAQVSGGYLADPGYVDIPDLAQIGFPLAEVSADGSAIISKLVGTGGRVDRLSCTAQLLYEIEDPRSYLQPDAVADFSGVRFMQTGPDQVRVTGATAQQRPDLLKVTLGYRDGFIGEGQISYAGAGAQSRGELALVILKSRMQGLGWGDLEQRGELIGVNALHGPQPGKTQTPEQQLASPYEVRMRFAMRCSNQVQALRVGQEVEALYLNGPAGGGGATQSVREVVAAASALIPRSAVQIRCTVLQL